VRFDNPKEEPCAELLDTEPTVISGYSLTEFVTSLLLNIVFWPLSFALILLPFGYAVIGGMIGILFGGALVMKIGSWLEKNKEGKPNGYYSLIIFNYINKVFPLGFVNKDSRWEINRDR